MRARIALFSCGFIIAAAALGCSGPIGPEKAPDRTITVESEGGFNLKNPTESGSLGCTADYENGSGTSHPWFREWLDDHGRVIQRTRDRYEELMAYDDLGRIAFHDLGGSSGRRVFTYVGDVLQVSLDGRSDVFRLDEGGRIAETLVNAAVVARFDWIDDVRLRAFSDETYSHTFAWDADGFPLESSMTTIGAPTSTCARHFTWTKSERALSVVVRSLDERMVWSATFSFDGSGRMLRAATTTEEGWTTKSAWTYDAAGVTEVTETPYSGTTYFHASPACHYPPGRTELATVMAKVKWAPMAESRPTHRSTLVGPLALPSPECVLAPPPDG